MVFEKVLIVSNRIIKNILLLQLDQCKFKMIFRICILLFVCSNLNNYASAQNSCCKSTNILFDNFTCWDASNVTVLTCELKKFMGPEHNRALDFDIDEDKYLRIEENEDYGYVLIAPTK